MPLSKLKETCRVHKPRVRMITAVQILSPPADTRISLCCLFKTSDLAGNILQGVFQAVKLWKMASLSFGRH